MSSPAYCANCCPQQLALPPPPYRITTLLTDPVDPDSNRIPDQSPAAGVVVAPSPLVSPPIVSSRSEVNVIGCVAVPLAINDPDPNTRSHAVVRLAEVLRNFTTTPG